MIFAHRNKEVEKSLDLTDLRNAVEILQKAQKLVGGENED